MQIITEAIQQTARHSGRLQKARDILIPQDVLTVKTNKGMVTIQRKKNQHQCFLPVTVQMELEEAVKWAFNTKEFEPWILENKYSTSRHKYYTIVRPHENGMRIRMGIESLWEIVQK
jgi:hypothetical protein